ncbi:hypothetical protein C8R44DRAFT_784258 [Mycena epipterygia]|nr:hypothetical protein C8R44DRAFT_784258 [Mycena epipterygia]
MCDTIPTLQTSIAAGTQSLVSGTTFGYICLAVGSASPAIYAAHHYRPSKKLARLEDAIKVAEGILKHAKEDCARDHVDLLDVENRLLQLKFSVSEIRSQMLDEPGVLLLFESNVALGFSARMVAWYGSLKKYLQTIRGITKNISKCRKEVEKIRTSTLHITEEERRRKLFGAMREVREVIEVLRSPTRTESEFYVFFSQFDAIYRSRARCLPLRSVQHWQFFPGFLYDVSSRHPVCN